MPALATRDPRRREPLRAALVLRYLVSAVFHALPASWRARRTRRVLDHAAMHLLIARTCTPFTLGAVRGAWGWTQLAVIRRLAALPVPARCTLGFRYPRLTATLSVAMGWLALVAIHSLVWRMSLARLAWPVAGGPCSTGGVALYATDARLRYGHAVWRLLVMAAARAAS